MGNKNSRRRDGTVRGMWRTVWHTTWPAVPAAPVNALLPYQLEQPRMRYHARACEFIRGEWRAEPVNYQGRGVVYLFHGATAEAQARAFAADKNFRDGFS